MQSHARLQGCVAHCIDCGIRFLTHPRNAGRRNLRCPFGCRQHHRRQRSNQRSAAYYRTATGRRLKKHLNGRRSLKCIPGGSRPVSIAPPSAANEPEAELIGEAPPVGGPQADPLPPAVQQPLEAAAVELRLEGVVLDESSLASSPMVPHVRMVIGLIEGVHLSCREVVGLLRQTMRQRSFGDRSRIDYVLGFLHQHPP